MVIVKSVQSRNAVNNRALQKFAFFILICILVFHGTYLRNRAGGEVPTMDWLILARLLTCAIGAVVGIMLLPKDIMLGAGSKMLMLYVLATGISAISSPYPVPVIGYFILLLGASVLMFGLVYNARNVIQLKKIEKIWIITVGTLITKDVIISLLAPVQDESETIRLGMGVTHANVLSLFAVLLFWMSFTCKDKKKVFLLWVWRAFLLYVILAAVCRVSIVAFVIGGLCYVLFQKKGSLNHWVMVFSFIGLLVTIFALNLSFNQSWANTVTKYIKRGQTKIGLSTFTGRTDIWRNAANQSLEAPFTGYGYGVSRLTLDQSDQDFQAMHCHNEALEVFFTTGLLGLIPFLAMFVYSLNWMIRSSQLDRTFSPTLTLHAICVVAILLVSSVFEARLGTKLSPTHLLFFFYLLALDRERYFKSTCSKAAEKGYPNSRYSGNFLASCLS